MKFPGAKYGLKMACGENPKRVYARRGGPQTRMGNVAGYRAAWIKAEAYRRKWDKWLAEPQGRSAAARPGARDAGRGAARQHPRRTMHCYRADEMAQMIDISHEFGYKIRAFHHGVEAYKIADLLAKEGIGAAVWADWGGFKMEAMDAVPANMALLWTGGRQGHDSLGRSVGLAAAESGSREGDGAGTRDRHQHHGRRRDEVDDDQSRVGARSRQTRSARSRPGKNADVVLWSGDPFSVYTRAEKVWIDGAMLFDRSRSDRQQWRTRLRAGLRARCGDGRDQVMPSRLLNFGICALGAALVAALVATAGRRADDRHHRRQGVSGERPADRERHGAHSGRQDRRRGRERRHSRGRREGWTRRANG